MNDTILTYLCCSNCGLEDEYNLPVTVEATGPYKLTNDIRVYCRSCDQRFDVGHLQEVLDDFNYSLDNITGLDPGDVDESKEHEDFAQDNMPDNDSCSDE